MKNQTIWIAGWVVAVLVLINYSIYQKESHLSNGTTVCLKLVPRDPRSLMQGDYMALRFALADKIRDYINKSADRAKKLEYSDGYVQLKLKSNCTVSFGSLQNKPAAKSNNSIYLHYRIRHHRIKIATNAFFFQEGTANRYNKAKYGVFKINNDGDPLLIALKDEKLKTLGNTK
jgi:uncharacterized membrane-anchored protein